MLDNAYDDAQCKGNSTVQ